MKTLTSAMPIVARALADNLGVKLRFGGDIASTDGKVINLPNIDPDDVKGAEIAYGYLAHEASHVKHTDFSLDVFGGVEPSPIEARMTNLVEDLRIEQLMMNEYPGSRRDLDALAVHLFRGSDIRQNIHPAAILLNGLLLNGCARYLRQPIREEADQALVAMVDVLGKGKTSKVMGLLGASVGGLSSTAESFGLAKKLLSVLEEEPEEDKQDPSDTAENPDEQSGGNAEPEPSADTDDLSGPSNDQGDGEDSSTPCQQQTTDDAQGDDWSSNDDNLIQQIMNATDEDLQGVISDKGQAASELLRSHADYSQPTPADLHDVEARQSDFSDQIAEKAFESAMGLRAVLNGLMQGVRNTRPSLRRTGRSPDSTRIARLMVGDSRIFRHKDPIVKTNAALQVLLDNSPSMQSTIRQATVAVASLLQAMDGLPGVNPAGYRFPVTVNGRLGIAPILKHGEMFQKARRDGRFAVSVEGSTPLAQALWTVSSLLVRQREDRKILIVVTDGDPDDVTSATDIIERCRNSGVEVLGIAMGTQSSNLRVLFGSNYRYISGVSDLRQALFELVQNILTAKVA
ncbi:hypothetical protein BLL42_27160 (plasmid) [Pseudomonas frederiksbergensis]|uniref:VWFA domain-containing protein n=1 Tax=Pseudomonas frederiksbergensis TaxID=104087 RepID=A0A1J0EUE6_9PSED|nr:VWA domain-containing protein [Pseudomonas frederiksbergensis]APC19420.1 hypothetical protein BLL42_27160 [Pseudomonas frederiksbergensis]